MCIRDSRIGVSDIVNGTSTVKECLIEYENGISFLPLGQTNPNNSQPITEFGARKLCRQLTLLNHSVIIHSPNMDHDLQTVQSLAAATRCTASVMKFDTPFSQVREIHNSLKHQNPNVDLLTVGSRMPKNARETLDSWRYIFPGIAEQTTPI